MFASRISTEHSGGHITNEIRGLTHKMPIGYLGGHFVKVIRGFIYNVPTGHIGGYFVNEIRGFVYKIFTGHLVGYIVNEIREFIHNIPTGYWGGYFLKEPAICLVGICWENCFKTHNELTIYPLGKCPFVPSETCCLWFHLHVSISVEYLSSSIYLLSVTWAPSPSLLDTLALISFTLL